MGGISLGGFTQSTSWETIPLSDTTSDSSGTMVSPVNYYTYLPLWDTTIALGDISVCVNRIRWDHKVWERYYIYMSIYEFNIGRVFCRHGSIPDHLFPRFPF